MSALAVEGNLERWRTEGGARLGHRMEQHKNNENKIHGGVNRPPIGGPKHNNQPKTGVRNGGEHVGDMRQVGSVGEVRCHHFGGIVSWIGGKKIK